MNNLKPEIVEKLVEGLRTNARFSEELKNLLRDENKALKVMAAQELFRLSKEKDSLLIKIQYVDDILKGVIEEVVAAAKDNKPAALTLTVILPLLTETDRQVVEQYRQNLRELRREIRTQTLINQRATLDTLSCLNEAVNLLTGPGAQAPVTYGAAGFRPRSAQPSLISREV
ncbi:flagellar export chaperone FlgN [Desulfobacterota bacterium M19]